MGSWDAAMGLEQLKPHLLPAVASQGVSVPLNPPQVLWWGARVEVLAQAVGLSEECRVGHRTLQCLLS